MRKRVDLPGARMQGRKEHRGIGRTEIGEQKEADGKCGIRPAVWG